MGKVEHEEAMDHNKFVFVCVLIDLYAYYVQFLCEICKIWSKNYIQADSWSSQV